ncbi:MAG: 3-deoxy-manno-octulosonate cytidylyltransferase [Rickettsiales bacterium]
MNEFVIIIPARLDSSRLKNKMLAEIGGIPMICHAAERATESNIGSVLVGTDSEEIKNTCTQRGLNVMMTDPKHQSGTDRVFEVLEKIDPGKQYKYVINLQGDIPFINPRIIEELANKISHSDADILTLASKHNCNEKSADPNVVNVAISFYDKEKKFGRALYFSRQAIPHNAKDFYEHVGIYLYRREALEKFVKITDSELETSEKLEQLRALEHHMKIDVCIVEDTPINIDTQKGLEMARTYYEKTPPIQS